MCNWRHTSNPFKLFQGVCLLRYGPNRSSASVGKLDIRQTIHAPHGSRWASRKQAKNVSPSRGWTHSSEGKQTDTGGIGQLQKTDKWVMRKQGGMEKIAKPGAHVQTTRFQPLARPLTVTISQHEWNTVFTAYFILFYFSFFHCFFLFACRGSRGCRTSAARQGLPPQPVIGAGLVVTAWCRVKIEKLRTHSQQQYTAFTSKYEDDSR